MFNRGRFRSRSIPTVNAADMHTNSQSPSSPGGNPSGTTPTFNEAVIDRIENIIGNALMGRADMFKKLFDPRRDVDEECGFPKGEITPQMYQDLFDRDSIAARVVEVLPEESWQTTPTVYESEDTEDITQFEDTWDNLSKQLRGSSHYQDEEGSPIWEYLCRADKLSGIGQYGVILLGLDDGLPLNMPVQTWDDRKPDNTYPGATGGYTNPASSVTAFGQDHTGVGTDAQYQSQYSPIYPTGEGKIATRDNVEDETTKGSKVGKGVKGKTDKGVKDKTSSKTPKDTFLNTPDSGTPGKKTEDVKSKLMKGSGEEEDTSYPASSGKTYDQSSPGHEQDYQLEYDDSEEDDSELEESDESEGDNTSNGLTPSEIELIVKGISGDTINPDDLESAGLLGEDGEPLDTDGQYLGPKYEPRVNITYIRVFPQAQAQITQYERDIHSPRFGQPVMYMITFNDPRMQHSGTGLPIASQNVHWTRIIHIADNLTSSEVFGVERMRPVLNNLLSLKKLYPGSAEMYWRGAFPGYSLETNPQLGGDVAIDADATRDMMEDYSNGLQRFLLLMGMSAKSLAPQVVDPTPQINVQLEAICIKLGIPIRVFKGSERGELASSQDDEAWNDRLKKRQQQYITPRIIVPFVDRLINIGVLPKPKGFSVAWQDLDSLNDSEKATNANTKTTALAAYISGSCESLITPKDYLVHFMQFTDEQAESMIEAAKKEADDKAEEQQALADEHGMVPTPPEGFQHDPENLPPGIAPDGSPLPQSPPQFGGQGGQPGVSNPSALPPKQVGKGQPPTKPGSSKPPTASGKPTGIDPGKFGEKLKPNPIPKPVANVETDYEETDFRSKVFHHLNIINNLLANAYNPDQPRDELGRFSSISSDSENSKTVASAHATLKDLHSRFPVLRSVTPPHLEVVNKVDTSNAIGLADPSADIYGTYAHGQGKITLLESIPDKGEISLGGPTVGYSKEIAFRHEYGHHVQDSMARPTDPNTGRQLSWQNITKPYLFINPETMSKQTPAVLISTYASLSHKETFAESFAVYTDPNYTRGTLPKPIERYMDLLLTGDTVHNEYNPDQPRDNAGRFASMGGGGNKTELHPVASFPVALPHDAPPMALPVHVPEAIPVNNPTHDATHPLAHPHSSPGDKATPQGLKAKAQALFTQGKAKLSGYGSAIYNKLPKPIQKVVDVGQAIEHGLEGAYHSGQKLAKEVAAQRGGDEKHVERVGKYLAWGDGVSRWTANIPVVHEALHVVAHIGGPVGFIGAKVGYYVPVASLGYIGYSMGREAVAKKNPFAMVSRARKAMQAKAAQEKEQGVNVHH